MIEITDEMRRAFRFVSGGIDARRLDDGLRAVLAIVEHDASKAEHKAYADGYRRGRDGYLPDRPLYIAGQRADHAWQEFNEHGNSCHFPTCIFTRDEHAS